jgi:hypothetical protein
MHSQATESLFANMLNADFCNTIGHERPSVSLGWCAARYCPPIHSGRRRCRTARVNFNSAGSNRA